MNNNGIVRKRSNKVYGVVLAIVATMVASYTIGRHTIHETEPTNTNPPQTTTTTTTEIETPVVVKNMTMTVTNDEVYDNVIEEPVINDYIVYKPSTHYVHKSTCSWVTDDCYPITSTEGLDCIKCSECNPDIEIVTYTEEYVDDVSNNISYGSALDYITETEYIYLCNTVAHEYGSDWISIYDKACVVACVMNRVYDGGWTNGNPSTVYNVLTAPYQFNPAYCTDYYQDCVTQSCKDAVDYYFTHQSEFPHYTSFWGDGSTNYFS